MMAEAATAEATEEVQDDLAAQDLEDFSREPEGEQEPPPPEKTTTEDPPETETADPFLQRLEEFGFTDVKDRADAEQRLIDSYSDIQQQLDEQQRWRKDHEQYVAYGREYIAKRPQQDASTRETPERKPWEPPVPYPDELAKKWLERDESGAVKFKEGVPAPDRATIEQWMSYQEGLVSLIADRPDKFFGELLPQFIQQHVQQYVEPFYEQRTQEQRDLAEIESFRQEYSEKLFRTDPRNGQPVYLANGNRALTAYGELVETVYVDLMDSYDSQGRRKYTAAEALEEARLRAESESSLSPSAKPETNGNPTAQQRRREVVERSRTPKRNRTGSVPSPDETRRQNDNGGFGADFVAELERIT